MADILPLEEATNQIAGQRGLHALGSFFATERRNNVTTAGTAAEQSGDMNWSSSTKRVELWTMLSKVTWTSYSAALIFKQLAEAMIETGDIRP